jgi:hypothetical protein
MKKYNKPTVEVVSLKSSEHIAKTTFSEIKGQFIENALKYNGKNYAVSQYAITSSTTKVDA